VLPRTAGLTHVVIGVVIVGIAALPLVAAAFFEREGPLVATVVWSAVFVAPFAAIGLLRRQSPAYRRLPPIGPGLWVPIWAAVALVLGLREWIMMVSLLVGDRHTLNVYDALAPYLAAIALLAGGAATSWAAARGWARQLAWSMAYLGFGAAVVALLAITQSGFRGLGEPVLLFLLGRAPAALLIAAVLSAAATRGFGLLLVWASTVAAAVLCEGILLAPSVLLALPCVPTSRSCLLLVGDLLAPATQVVVAAIASATALSLVIYGRLPRVRRGPGAGGDVAAVEQGDAPDKAPS
jgi:hypothetical protein